MADEQKRAEMADDEVEMTTGAGGETQAGNDANDVAAELERTRAALRKANREAAANRKRLEELEQAEQDRQQAELSEAERWKKKAEETERQLAEVTSRQRQLAIRHAVEMAAQRMNFHDAADALSLADLSSVEVADDGSISGVDEALKALAKAKPHLIKSQAGSAPDINGNDRGRSRAPTNDELVQRKRAGGNYSIF